MLGDLVAARYSSSTSRCLGCNRMVTRRSLTDPGCTDPLHEGNIKPYPDRLLCFLRDEYPNTAITMANRGISGEEAPIELKRFDTDVIAQKAALSPA